MTMNRSICILICLIGLVLSECKTTSKSTVTTVTISLPEPPPIVEDKPAAPDAMVLGQTVYQTKCKGCHDLPNPVDYGYSEWSDIMVKMSRKAHLSDAETDQVLAYVHGHSKL
jgi:hypothetical protein